MTEQISILDKTYHKRLIEGMTDALRDANISERFIHTSLSQHASGPVLDYIRGFKQQTKIGNYGLLVCGYKYMNAPEEGMQAIVASLTRNFIRARVVTLQGFMDNDDDDLQDYTALAIPNLLTGSKSALPEWAFAGLADRLSYRKLKGRQTIMWATSMNEVETVYGTDITRALKRDFVVAE